MAAEEQTENKEITSAGGSIDAALHRLATAPPPGEIENCQAGRYYLLNNYNAGYNIDGTVNMAPYTVPPQKSDYVTIGDWIPRLAA